MEDLEYFVRICPQIMEGVFDGSVRIRFRVTASTSNFKFNMKELELKSVEVNGLVLDLSTVSVCEEEKDLYEISYSSEPDSVQEI
jgi:hypothetical protein